MAGHRGYYSLIQYCPDPSRAEVANVGVLLFCPDLNFIDAKVSKGNQRIAKMFGRGSFRPDVVSSAKNALTSRLLVERERFKSFEDLQKFVATRANEIVLSEPRPMKVLDAAADLVRLFNEVVGGAIARGEHKSQSKFPDVEQVFRQPQYLARTEFNVSMQIPVIGRTMKVPFVFQNGCLNLFKPQRFAHDDATAKDTAMLLAVEGQLLQNYPEPGQKRRFIVVSVADQLKSELRQDASELFRVFDIELVAKGELPGLLQKLSKMAH